MARVFVGLCFLLGGCLNADQEYNWDNPLDRRGTAFVGGDTASGDPSPGDAVGGDSTTASDVDFSVLDQDGDTISDLDEGRATAVDTDGDGTQDWLDDDSDGDGVADAVEAGDANLATLPADTDSDGIPDFRDRDSDGDLATDTEETGCPGTSNRLDPDSDDDGAGDLVELAAGSAACDGGTIPDPTRLYLVAQTAVESTQQYPLVVDRTMLDLHYNIAAGGADAAIASAATVAIAALVDDVQTLRPTVWFGLSRFVEFPGNPFGAQNDVPFALMQRLTSNTTAFNGQLSSLSAAGGGDQPNSGWEALYQVMTGEGVTWTGTYPGFVNVFSQTVNQVVGVADGPLPGVGFRQGSARLVVHIENFGSHDASEYSAISTTAHSMVETQAAAIAAGAHVIGITGTSAAHLQLRPFAADIGTVVPVCAFADACGANKCCTAASGLDPVGNGACPLVYEALTTEIEAPLLQAIQLFLNYTPFDVTTRVVRNESDFSTYGVDSSCLVSAVVPTGVTPRNGCALPFTLADSNDDQINDKVLNAQPGSTVTFDVRTWNDSCATTTSTHRVFTATLEVYLDGTTRAAEKSLTLIVPGN